MSDDDIPALPPARTVPPARLPLRRTVATHPGARTPEDSLARAMLSEELIHGPDLRRDQS